MTLYEIEKVLIPSIRSKSQNRIKMKKKWNDMVLVLS